MPGRPLLILAGAALLLGGCSNAVELDDSAAGRSSGTLCRSLLEDAPPTVAGADSREVEPAGAGAAWGDPAVILQCAVPKPAGLRPTSRCDEIGGVGWFATMDGDAYVFTTIGRETYVRVTVPAAYDPPADALIDLADTIKKHDPVVRRCA